MALLSTLASVILNLARNHVQMFSIDSQDTVSERRKKSVGREFPHARTRAKGPSVHLFIGPSIHDQPSFTDAT